MNRRRFLKYAGVSAAVVGASALGFATLLKPASIYQTISSTTVSTGFSTISSELSMYAVPTPVPLKSETNLAAYYLPSWHLADGYPRIETLAAGSYAHPLLGRAYPSDAAGTYDVSNRLVTDWQIKWAVEHGVSTFVMGYNDPSWYWESHNIDSGFLTSKYIDYMKFFFYFDITNGHWSSSPSLTEKQAHSTISYMAQNHFSHPSYLGINGKPMLLLYHATLYGDGTRTSLAKYGTKNLQNVVKAIRDAAADVWPRNLLDRRHCE